MFAMAAFLSLAPDAAGQTNNPAEGKPRITGTPEAGERLTIDYSNISDPDGLDDVHFRPNWIEVDGGEETVVWWWHNKQIYRNERGKRYKVRVDFTDDAGNPESVTSDLTAAVRAENSRPTFFTYPLHNLSTLREGAQTISHEREGYFGPQVSVVPVNPDDVLDPPLVTRPSDPVVAGVRFAYNPNILDDRDGVSGSTRFTYRWQRKKNGPFIDIPGATDRIYRIRDPDVGYVLRIQVTYTDNAGYTQTVDIGQHRVTGGSGLVWTSIIQGSVNGASSQVLSGEESRTVMGWTSGDSIHVDFTFDGPVTVDVTDGTPSVRLRLNGSNDRTAEYASGSGTATLRFTYRVKRSDGTVTAVAVPTNSLALNGGSIVPEAGGAVYIVHGAFDYGDDPTTTQTAAEEDVDNSEEETPTVAPLTAAFRSVPAEHDASTAFTFELHFSEAPKALSHRTLLDRFFQVANGTVRSAKRKNKGDHTTWQITVKPAWVDDVTIGYLGSLADADCAEAAVICTADGAKLLSGNTTIVQGPASFSVADATVQEGPNATLDFVVTLSRARHEATTVDYATSDGTATAGSDYTSDSGTLSFAIGETEKTVSVAVLDDNVDEGGETITFTLSNPVPSATAKLGDATATGEILNEESPLATEPQIAGVPQVGNTLEVSFEEAPDGALVYQWLRGSEAIAGATASTYVPTAADVGEQFSVQVTRGDESVTSTPTAPVWPAPVNPPLAAGEEELLSTTVTLGSHQFRIWMAGYGRVLGASFGVMADTSFEDDGATHTVDLLAVNGIGQFALATGATLPEATGLLAYWNGYRISDLETQTARGVQLLLGRTPQPGTEYWRYWDGASDGVRVAVSLRRASVTRQDAGTSQDALTARFDEVPEEHDGSSAFDLELHFSEAPKGLSYRTLSSGSFFNVTNGTVTNATRLQRKDNSGWLVTVESNSDADVTIALPAALPDADCADAAVVCTAEGTRLSGRATAVVPGPASLSVADATVQEGPNATLDFVVSLSRARHEATTVDYATSDGTATAGSDYTADSGTLSFAIGETEKTVSVTVLDDAHDEGSETMTFTLSNPVPAATAKLGDATATGTINNSDPMPQAWIARFGRTVAEQVVDAVQSRMQAARTPGVEVSLAGQRIGGGPAAEADEARAAEAGFRSLAEWVRGEEDGETATGLQSRAVTGRDFLIGSSFALTGGSRERGFASLWGRGAISSFDGREGELTLDGEVQSAMVGADWGLGATTAGVMVSHSRGEGGYRSPSGGGDVESTLTGLYPYGHHAVSDRLSLWGVAGYGKGSLTLTPEGEASMETDMDLTLAGAGLRSVMVAAPAEGGLELAANSDGFVVRTSSDRTQGLASASAEVTRLRLGLEGTWRGGPLVPSVEIGVRHDGGDAETGFGADIGAGLSWSDPASGIAAELRGRGLLTHADGDFRESGFAGSLSWDPSPSSARGPTLTLSQTVGAQASGGMDSLLSRPTMAGLAANDDGGTLDRRRLEARLGYGFPLLGDRFVGTPEIGLGLSDTGREYSLGWRLALARSHRVAFDLALEGTRREAANDDALEHGLRLRGALRW